MRYHFRPTRMAAYSQRDGQYQVSVRMQNNFTFIADGMEQLYNHLRKQFGDFV